MTARALGAASLTRQPQPILRNLWLQRPYQLSRCRHLSDTVNSHPQILRHGIMATAGTDREILVTSKSFEVQRSLQDRIAQERLKLDGGGFAAPCYEPQHMHAKPHFDTDAYFNSLAATVFGATIISAASLPSTQSFLQQHAQSFPDGTVCVADVQNQGKGRGGNTWTSPPGCLMFSLLTNLELPGTRLPFIQYVVSLAIVEAIHAEAHELLQDACQLNVRIKWPNDIYSGSNKLGGILCHTVYRDRRFQAIIGVGLNVSNAEPSTCLNSLLGDYQRSVQQSDSVKSISREALLARILGILEQHIHTLKTEGFAPLEGAYLNSWLHTGQQVTIKGRGDEQDVNVTIQGLTSEGYLLAEAAGQHYSLSPDGNSLDFFQGLIKSKLPS